MNELPVWLPVVGVLAIAGLIFGLAAWSERRRTEALGGAYLRLGMRFAGEPQDPELEDPGLRGLPLFQKGRSRKLANAGRAEDGWFFDYRFTTGSGRQSSTHSQTVAALRRGSPLPTAGAAPAGILDRIGAVFGGRDIDFPEDAEFSQRFRLRGDDETAVRRLFSPALRAELVSAGDWSVETGGSWILVYRAQRRVDPDALPAFVTETRRLAALLAPERYR